MIMLNTTFISTTIFSLICYYSAAPSLVVWVIFLDQNYLSIGVSICNSVVELLQASSGLWVSSGGPIMLDCLVLFLTSRTFRAFGASSRLRSRLWTLFPCWALLGAP